MKLTKKQQDMLWGEGGPYSEAKLIREVRILDDRVSRIFLVVEVAINPTTFELIEKQRNSEAFKNDPMVQQLLDHAEYRGPKFGYVSMAFSGEYTGVETMVDAEHALRYAQDMIITMHRFLMGRIKADALVGTVPMIEDEDDFKESINIAIDRGDHVEYLRRVLENYEWYKREFAKVFLDGDPNAIYRFRVTYDLKKGVWREIEIRGGQTFEELARAIVSAMGWDYDHMHGFTIPGIVKKPSAGVQFEGPTRIEFFAPHWEDDPFPTYKSDQIRICQIDHANHPVIDFIFDFGDGHEFTLAYQGIRSAEAGDKKTKFPVIVDQKGIAPKQYR